MKFTPAFAAMLLASTAMPCFAQGAGEARGSAQPINTLASNKTVQVELLNNETVATFYLSGLTASGATLAFEGSSDSRNINDSLKVWFSIPAIQPAQCPPLITTSTTTDGNYKVDASGLTNIRVRVSSLATIVAPNVLVSFNAINGASVSPALCGWQGTGMIPSGAVSIFNSTSCTTGACQTVLSAAVAKTTYLCGFVLTSGGTTTAAVGNATVSPMAGGVTGNFTYVDVSSGQGILGVAAPPCLPASAANTAITVTMPAGGTGTNAAVTAWGYQL